MRSKLKKLQKEIDNLIDYKVFKLEGKQVFMTEKQYLQAKHQIIDEWFTSFYKQNKPPLDSLQDLENLHANLSLTEKDLRTINSDFYDKLTKIGYFNGIL